MEVSAATFKESVRRLYNKYWDYMICHSNLNALANQKQEKGKFTKEMKDEYKFNKEYGDKYWTEFWKMKDLLEFLFDCRIGMSLEHITVDGEEYFTRDNRRKEV